MYNILILNILYLIVTICGIGLAFILLMSEAEEEEQDESIKKPDSQNSSGGNK